MGMMPVGPRKPPDFVKMMQRVGAPLDNGASGPGPRIGSEGAPKPLVHLPHGMVPAGHNAMITGVGIQLASVSIR